MMRRRVFRAVVTDESGSTILGERDTFAWNSAIRATEAILREYGRNGAGALHGAPPVVMEPEQAGNDSRIYRRLWTADSGATLRALVWEVV